MKQAAKTLNFLTENNILQYADLQAKIAEVSDASDKTGDALKDVEKRLSDMALLIKDITTYQQTKPVYDSYRKSRNKERFRRENESSLILHEAATKALKTVNALYAEYGKLKKQVKEYDVIKKNVDKILKPPQEEKAENRGVEL